MWVIGACPAVFQARYPSGAVVIENAAETTKQASVGPAGKSTCVGNNPCGMVAPLNDKETTPVVDAISCRSSGVEHSLGKGEVQSSNLCGSTIKIYRK
jgi:hypothetical protein